MIYNLRFLLLILIPTVWTLISCHTPTEEELLKKKVLDFYTDKYGFTENAYIDVVYSELADKSLNRVTWDLDNDKIESYMKIFYGPKGSRSISINSDEAIVYREFIIVFDSKGRTRQIGFIDDLDRFSGDLFFYEYKDMLTKKKSIINNHRFYKVIYTLDYVGVIVDSLIDFFPIIMADKETFDGPSLSVCFDVQLIIDRNRDDFEDFSLWYQFYDTKGREHIFEALNDGTIYEGTIPTRKDGHYYFCQELELKYHLLPYFGFHMDPSISEQTVKSGSTGNIITNRNYTLKKF